MRETKLKFSKKDRLPVMCLGQKNGYSLKGKLWVEGKNGIFLGYGRIVLLERIKQYGSISKAAKSMKMAYRHAWDLVDSVNRQAMKPFVETATGGKKGGGAILTKHGEKAVEEFWKFHNNFKDFLCGETKKIEF
ncbi:MAG: ModE family transcriptional regulator [bacterium]